MSRHPTAAGMGLIECLVTLTVLALLSAAAAPSWSRWLLRQRHKVHFETLHSDLNWARQLALYGGHPVLWRVQHSAGGDCYVLYRGNEGDCDCEVGRAPRCDGTVQALRHHDIPQASRLSLQASANRIRYDAQQATVSPTATVSLSAPDGERGDHIVALTGRIRTCVTHRALYAAPRCAA